MTWKDAETYCQTNDLNLAVVQTDDDWYRLNAAAESKGLTATGWIGLYQNIYDWYWSSNGVFWMNPGFITYWEPGQPDNLGGIEYCCTIDSSGFWADNPCTDLKPFICFEGKPCEHVPYLKIPYWGLCM